MRVKKKENDWSVAQKSLINEPLFIHMNFFIFFACIRPRLSALVPRYPQSLYANDPELSEHLPHPVIGKNIYCVFFWLQTFCMGFAH
jgi:hypothetical protein